MRGHLWKHNSLKMVHVSVGDTVDTGWKSKKRAESTQSVENCPLIDSGTNCLSSEQYLFALHLSPRLT
jgi:hypothetical protein